MKTQRADAVTCLPASATSATQAAQVVVAGGVAIAAGATVVAALGGGVVITASVAVLIAVAVTVAARRTLASLFAGLTLQLARPYSPGEQIRLFVPELGEVTEAQVVKLGAVSTTLGTSTGLVVVPNAQMLRVAPDCRAA